MLGGSPGFEDWGLTGSHYSWLDEYMNDHLTDIWNSEQLRRGIEWTAADKARPAGGRHFAPAERPSLLRRLIVAIR